MAEKKGKEAREVKGKSLGVSRREFLRDAGLLVGGASIGSMAFLNGCKSNSNAVASITSTSTITVTSPPITVVNQTAAGEVAEAIVTLNVNGDNLPVMVRPNWTLQHVLNDKLGLTGTKEWCDGGACGSCSVIVNGKAVLSCMMLAIECTGVTIETIEGIAASGHPIVQAYMDNNCMQCGYCTPGFIVTAKALLDQNPNPTVPQVQQALAGNLCRCTTYPQHPLAVQQAAAMLASKATSS
jgi:aerobic-type carbon monoxide dehydrogenase small subunit (CoxS/CutS family)